MAGTVTDGTAVAVGSCCGFGVAVIAGIGVAVGTGVAVAAGLGVGFWPHYTWGRNEIEGVLLLPIKEPDCRRDIVLQLHYQNGADQKEAEEFFEYLGDYLQNQKKNVT